MLSRTNKNVGNTYLISINGNLMLNNIEILDNQFKEVIENEPEIIGLDCHKLNSLDSSGLSLFLRLQKDSDKYNFDLYFCHLNENVTTVFDITKLNHILSIISLEDFEQKYF